MGQAPRNLQVDCQEKPKPVGFVAVNTDSPEMFPFALGLTTARGVA